VDLTPDQDAARPTARSLKSERNLWSRQEPWAAGTGCPRLPRATTRKRSRARPQRKQRLPASCPRHPSLTISADAENEKRVPRRGRRATSARTLCVARCGVPCRHKLLNSPSDERVCGHLRATLCDRAFTLIRRRFSAFPRW